MLAARAGARGGEQREAQQYRKLHQLIRRGIQNFPHVGDPVVSSCQVAVQHVGGGGEEEDTYCRSAIAGGEQTNKERYAQQSDHGQQVWNVFLHE